MPTTLTDVAARPPGGRARLRRARDPSRRGASRRPPRSFPRDVLLKAAEIGLTCFDMPAEYGGGGIEDLLTACLIAGGAVLGRRRASATCICSGGVLRRHRRRARHRRAEAALGAAAVRAASRCSAALATTEPEAGSDAASITTHARRGRRRLRAQRPEDVDLERRPVASTTWSSPRSRPARASRGITAFVVERGDRGLRGRAADGASSASAASRPPSCSCTTAALPEDRRIGDEGQGFYGLMEKFDRSRITSPRPRSASAARRSSTPSTTPASARRSASRSTSTRPCRSASWTRA